MPPSWLDHPTINQALALGFSVLETEILVLALIIVAVGAWQGRRKKLGRMARRRWRNDLIAWGLIQRQEIEYSKEDTPEDAQEQALREQRETELILTWRRIGYLAGFWWGLGAAVGCLLGVLLLGLSLALPAASSDRMSSAYAELLVLMLMIPPMLGFFAGAALSIINNAGQGAPPRTLDDYRSPRIRWAFLIFALTTIVVVAAVAHQLFTHSLLSVWLLFSEYLLAGGAWLIVERLGSFALRWPREPLSSDPEPAALAAEKARAYAVTALLNLQFMIVWMLPLEALFLVMFLPGFFSSGLPAGILFILIFASIGGFALLNMAHGKLGGRLTGWPTRVRIRDPWEVDETLA